MTSEGMTGIFLRNSIQQRWIKWPTPDGSKLWIERAIDALWVKVFLSFFGHFILIKFLKNQEAQASVLVSQPHCIGFFIFISKLGTDDLNPIHDINAFYYLIVLFN